MLRGKCSTGVDRSVAAVEVEALAFSGSGTECKDCRDHSVSHMRGVESVVNSSVHFGNVVLAQGLAASTELTRSRQVLSQ